VEALPNATAEELRERTSRRIVQDQQLVLSPAFFLGIPQRHPKISGVYVSPRRGSLDNEMTRFRYDAILHIGGRLPPGPEIPFVDPPEGEWTAADVRAMVTGRRADPIGIARVGNPRVDRHARFLDLVQNADPRRPFAKLCEQLDRYEIQGIHPEVIAGLAEETGSRVAMSWASCHSDGSYDAAFLPRHSGTPLSFGHIGWPRPASVDTICLASEPGKFEFCEQLVESLKTYCSARLPKALVPDCIYVVDSLPNAKDDTLDTDSLLSFHKSVSRDRTLV
jgi:hypothetical protein